MGATVCQYTASVGGGHSGTEAMFVGSFPVRRLECSFHWNVCFIVISFFFRVAKVRINFENANQDCFFLENLLVKKICPIFASSLTITHTISKLLWQQQQILETACASI